MAKKNSSNRILLYFISISLLLRPNSSHVRLCVRVCVIAVVLLSWDTYKFSEVNGHTEINRNFLRCISKVKIQWSLFLTELIWEKVVRSPFVINVTCENLCITVTAVLNLYRKNIQSHKHWVSQKGIHTDCVTFYN